MFRLALLLFVVIGATVAGVLIVAALVVGLDTKTPIAAAGLIGYVLAIPISWMVARQLS
jgi:hypothetical protein